MADRRWSDDPALRRYCTFFERLAPADLDRLAAEFTADARFRDPFNDVQGISEIRAVFDRMFKRCAEVRFEVHEALRDGDVALLHWSMGFRPAGDAGAEAWLIRGMSRIVFARDGRVAEHVDHWDTGSQLYARFPLLGPVIRWLQRKLA